MENYKDLWKESLETIRQRVNNSHIYDVWFDCITFDSYDPERHVLVLCVPSSYVYEYLETYCVRLLSEVLNVAFRTTVQLNYRIQKEPSFADCVDYLQQQGFNGGGRLPHFTIPNARKRMEDGLRYYAGEGYHWLDAYDQVVSWLLDNKGRGLLCVGTSGLGKTLVCRDILPVILGRNIPSVTAKEMNSRIDDLLKERAIIIDDLGKEDPEVKVYGNRRTPFFELCDAAEREGKLLIITTNLSTTPVNDPDYPTSIQERYGTAVIDRLRSITSVVIFRGRSLRR